METNSTNKRKRSNSKTTKDSSTLNVTQQAQQPGNEIWNLKIFNTKEALEKYINDQEYKYRSNEENTEKQSCRFCLANNPNSQKHMIQVYMFCPECRKSKAVTTCSKTNICEKLKRYEILNKHTNLDAKEWIICDQNIVLKENDNKIDEIILDSFSNLNIISKTRKEYYNMNNYYIWIVQDVFPNQTYLFKEIYFIKFGDEWKEFSNGIERYSFEIITDLDDEIILKKYEDDTFFKLNSKELFNCYRQVVEYEGEWIFDKDIQVN